MRIDKLQSALLASSLAMGAGCTAPETSEANVITTALSRPLIVGASVSAGYGTESPGARLARREVSTADVHTIAQGGKPGREIIRMVSEKSVADRTAIIAIDFLFWDSTLPGHPQSLDALERLIGYASKKKIPIVVGDVPNLLPGLQASRDPLNKRLRSICEKEPVCRVMKLDELHQSVLETGTIEVRGKHVSIFELIPDGLHLSPMASDFLADKILEALVSKPL